MTSLSFGTINFEHVTFTVTFDLLLKKKTFNIGHHIFILRDGAFIFGMCVSYDMDFPMVPSISTCDLDLILTPVRARGVKSRMCTSVSPA